MEEAMLTTSDALADMMIAVCMKKLPSWVRQALCSASLEPFDCEVLIDELEAAFGVAIDRGRAHGCTTIEQLAEKVTPAL